MSDKPSDGAVAEIYYDYELRVWRQRHTGGRGHSGDYVNEIIAMEYIDSLVERLAETEAKLREAEEDTERLIGKALAVLENLVVAPERESDNKPFQYLCDIKAGFPELMELREAIDKARGK